MSRPLLEQAGLINGSAFSLRRVEWNVGSVASQGIADEHGRQIGSTLLAGGAIASLDEVGFDIHYKLAPLRRLRTALSAVDED